MSHSVRSPGRLGSVEAAASPTSQPAAAASPERLVEREPEGWVLVYEHPIAVVLDVVAIIADAAMRGDESAQICLDEMSAAADKYCAKL